MKKLLGPFRSFSKSAEREGKKDKNSDKVVESSHKPVLRSDVTKKRRNVRDDEKEKSEDSLSHGVRSGSWVVPPRNTKSDRNATSLIDHSSTKFGDVEYEREHSKSNSMLDPRDFSKGRKIKRKSKSPPGRVPPISEDVHRSLQTFLAGGFSKKVAREF